MPSPAPPVAVTPLGRISAATVLWRMRGQRYLTAVVKATFALVPEGRMTLVDPDPIAFDEQPDPAGHGIRAAGDVAPFLNQADVWVTGHAELPLHFSDARLHVWLAVVQGGQVRIDKRLDLSRREEAQARVPIDGLGPLSRSWPRRSQLLRGLDPARLHGPALDIPDGLDWTYFQAVPADQRMDPLTADAWVVLGGMVLRRPKLRTELPDAHAVARLYRRDQAPPRAGEPIALRADTLQIDMDRRCCSIVWRGHATIGAADAASLRVAAALATPGQAIAWIDPFASAEAAPHAPHAPHAPQSSLESTIAISPEDAQRLMAIAGAPLPIKPPAARANKPEAPRAPAAAPTPPASAPRAPAPPTAEHGAPTPAGTTLALDDETASRHASAPATPFEGKRAAPPAAPAPPPLSDDARGLTTIALDHETAARLAATPATPFGDKAHPARAPAAASSQQPQRPPPPTDPIARPDVTMASITPSAIARLAAPATPFEHPKAAPAPATTPAATHGATPAAAAPRRAIPDVPASLEGTMTIDTAARVHAPATPFEAAPRAPVPPPPKPPAPPIPATAPPLAAAAPQLSPWASDATASSAAPPRPAAPATAPALVAPFASPAPAASLDEAPAAPPIGSDELAAWPPGLGADFLAAMADAGALR